MNKYVRCSWIKERFSHLTFILFYFPRFKTKKSTRNKDSPGKNKEAKDDRDCNGIKVSSEF